MNREEAKTKVMTIYGSLSEELKQAVDVLVDAPKSEWEQMGEMGTLLAEATKDCISRKAVLNILVKEEFKGDAIAEIEKLHYANPDLSEYSDKLYKLAYERGKAEGQEWIPVREKMPEDGKEVLFCDLDEDVMIGYHVKDRAKTHFTQCGTYEDMKNVQAWMPLPAPYK